MLRLVKSKKRNNARSRGGAQQSCFCVGIFGSGHVEPSQNLSTQAGVVKAKKFNLSAPGETIYDNQCIASGGR